MVYIHLKNKNGGVATPEFRLRSLYYSSVPFLECSLDLLSPAMVPGSLLLPIGFLIVGWTSEVHTHWIAVDIRIWYLWAQASLRVSSVFKPTSLNAFSFMPLPQLPLSPF
ncbi:hypothetical protein C8R48DRAFT_54890 [Suillus tomentosus]|nr:hypothetical protein C8R48DRAFT_54890 [Suillus tomentosus]